MKKFLILGMLGFALAGCTTAKEIATTITTSTQTTIEKAKEAQGYAVTVCGFLPALASVVAIFNSGFSSSVATVGNAVCDAVTSIPLADGPGDHKPRVNGIVIKGKFVR